MSVAALRDPFLEERLHRADLERRLTIAIQTSDGDALINTMNELYFFDAAVLRKLARLENVPQKSRLFIAALWVEHGSGWRSESESDLLLVDALRNLLPKYEGGPLTLYRGESANNRRRRTYGLSWTKNCEVAACFARNNAVFNKTVLLTTTAPPEAIICIPHDHLQSGPHHIEDEVLVDRRKLFSVSIIKSLET